MPLFHSAVTSSRSPVESEEIIASVDSSPSPMIRPPPPQLPLPRTNRYAVFLIVTMSYSDWHRNRKKKITMSLMLLYASCVSSMCVCVWFFKLIDK